MADISISYSIADRAWAEWLAWQLEMVGYKTSLYELEVRLDDTLILNDSDIFIAVLSPNYLISTSAKSEFERAFNNFPDNFEHVLLPVRVIDCHPEGLLGPTHYIDLVGLDENAAREELLAGVKNKRNISEAPPNFPGMTYHSVDKKPVFPGQKGSLNGSNSLNDLRRLIEDNDSLESLPDKEEMWETLLRLTRNDDENVRGDAAKSLGTIFRYILDKDQAWNNLHTLAEKNDNQVRHGIAQALGLAFPDIPDKEQAWADLHRLALDHFDLVRRASAWAIGTVFSQIPDKEQAWTDLHRLTEDEISGVRWATARALGDAFPNIPDKELAWADLIRLTRDDYEEVRWTAAKSLGSAYPYVPDKKQAWYDLHALTEDKDESVRRGIAMSFGIAYPHIPEEKQAWNDLHHLSLDNAVYVRMWAAKSIGMAFSHISDRQQAWNDLHRLTEDEDSRVRWRTSEALNMAYPFIPDKEQVRADLQRLAEDNNVRLIANNESEVIKNQMDTPSPIGTQMRARSDLRSSEDLLGFEDYANAFADLIESRYTDLPLTVGIYGTWGTGKSSLLDQIAKELDKRHKLRQSENRSTEDRPYTEVHIVNFNAWEYSTFESVWPGLVRIIMDKLEPNKEFSRDYLEYLGSKLKRNLKRQLSDILRWLTFIILFAFLIYSIIFIIIIVLGFNFNLELFISLVGLLTITGLLNLVEWMFKPLSRWIAKIGQKFEYGRPIDYMEYIHEDLEFLENRLREKKGRILVVIDDLDRCEPKKSVEILQAINLLLNFKSFIIFLGIDARIVTRAVEEHYKNLLGPAGASGYEYLEKIVQIPFLIPKLDRNGVEVYISELLGKPEPTTGEMAKASIRESSGQFVDMKRPAENETSIKTDEEPSIPETSEPTAFTYDELKAFKRFGGFLRPNPRHIKRLINVYSFARTLAKYKKKQNILDNPLVMILWLVICGQWPYTMHLMLYRFDKMSTEDLESLSDKDPLIYLLEEVNKISTDLDNKESKLDYDLDLLKRLLNENEGLLTWSKLEDLRQFTINFNPAIVAELKFEGEIKEVAN